MKRFIMREMSYTAVTYVQNDPQAHLIYTLSLQPTPGKSVVGDPSDSNQPPVK